jgi:hypothetical protein
VLSRAGSDRYTPDSEGKDVGKVKAQAAPKSVEELVRHALTLAATNPKAKWAGASAAALFNTKEADHEAAIAACTTGDTPLLKQVGKGGAITAAGFARIAGELPAEEARGAYDLLRDELPDDQVGGAAGALARRLPPGERVEFIQGVIRRTPLAATELTPVLEEAVAAAGAQNEARVAAAAKRKAADDAALAAMERAKQLFAELRRSRLDALKREYEAEGGDPSDLRPPEPERREPELEKPGRGPAPVLKTAGETDFRRYECDRLAAAWRDAWDAKKTEGAECLVDAMWNIRGFRMIGEAGAAVEFNGRYHESEQSVASGPVRVVRPGWLLKEEDGEYVALKAAVTRA